MCPLRFILVFISAMLAGYFALRTFRSSPEIEESGDSTAAKEKQELDPKRMLQNGFWGFVDMTSGRYLWRNLKGTKKID